MQTGSLNGINIFLLIKINSKDRTLESHHDRDNGLFNISGESGAAEIWNHGLAQQAEGSKGKKIDR